MTQTGLSEFNAAIQTSNLWLADVMDELRWEDRHRAHHAFQAVLRALRNRLPIDEAVQFGAQLPVLIRGYYYEAWDPRDVPVKERSKEDFLKHIADAFWGRSFLGTPTIDPEAVTRGVFRVIARHVSAGEIDDVKHVLPAAIRELWE